MDMKTYDYLTDLNDPAGTATEPPILSQRAERVVLIVCSTLASIIPAGLALLVGVPLTRLGHVLLLTTGPMGCACLLLRRRS
ncbi:hypothetical protein M2284_001367 [Rhodococcus sp. LBL1]|nr:hypothetical protein [Rhodococcus sp. LBL1]MDH6682538.1 hypothetical protein [Rhodococcus sp. LBL2]